MTKVQKQFALDHTVSSDALLERIGRAQAIYGIEWIKLSPAFDTVRVEFDASRLRVTDIEATLRRCGLPVVAPTAPEAVVTVTPPGSPGAPNQA